jgi:Ca2+-binding EF-hand superfamily protein
MFSLFDDNKDGNINFEEFVRGLSVFCEKGTIDEKLKCKIYLTK